MSNQKGNFPYGVTDPVAMQTSTRFDNIVKISTIVSAILILVLWIAFVDGGRSAAARLSLGKLDNFFIMPFKFVTSLVAISYIYKTWLWFRYRPVDGMAIESGSLPAVTVVIPAFNEGPMVQKSLRSVLGSDYPAERLQVICVDDGSQDDTLEYAKAVQSEFPERLLVIGLPENKGKRHALYEGFKRARGELYLTLDSDSIVLADTVRNMVAPLVQSEDVGAVAGSVRVYNRYQSFITRLLGVRYILGFDYIRAYQSQLNSVLCCPGALAAYRAETVRPHLDAWLNQQFLGNRCTNGDDHALTNVVLRSGLAVKYQSNAAIYTLVPATYLKLSRMYTRWARSNIRESYLFLRFAFERASERREWLALFDGIAHALHIPLRLYLLPFGLYVACFSPLVILQALGIATTVSAVYGLIFLRSEKSTDAIYSIVYTWYASVLLAWIYPAALLTVSKNNWMTRQRNLSVVKPLAKISATSVQTKLP